MQALEQMKTLVRAAQHRAVVTLQDMGSGDVARRARLNIENFRPLKAAGLAAGTRVRVEYAPGQVDVIADPQGTHVIAAKQKTRRDGTVAHGERLDLRNQRIAEVFGNQERVLVLYLADRLVAIHLPTVLQAAGRAERLAAAVARGTLEVGSLYTGLGTLDAALHDGMGQQGLTTHTAWTNDAWAPSVEAFLQDSPTADARTVTTEAGIAELLAMNALTECDLLVAGIPCTGSSRLNIRHREAPEFHPFAGHQVLNFAVAVAQSRPAVALVENVLAYADTASCVMLRRMLEEQGYATALIGDTTPDGRYEGLTSTDFGNIESRTRMALLAYPKGLDIATFRLEKTGPSARTVGDIRVDEATVDPAEYDKGLHLDRDVKLAKGWKNRIVEDAATQTPSLSASCWKQRVEDPKFRHPTDDGRWRLPRPEEHAALKGHDVRLIGMLTHDSHAHTALGNGTTKGPWVALGRALAVWLRDQLPALRLLASGPAVLATAAGAQDDLFASVA